MPGTLDVPLLDRPADGPLHGYDVVDRISMCHGTAQVQVDDGAYTSLHRMERRGRLDAI